MEMATQNPASNVTPPRIPTGQELFDAIMGYIEPELTTEGVKTLDAKYKNETPDQQLERRKRYARAYEQYEKAYQETMETLHAQINRYSRVSFEQMEQGDRTDEESTLNSLSQAFA